MADDLERPQQQPSLKQCEGFTKFDSLQSRVLKWSTDDITSSTMFKVGCIPAEFPSTEEYLGAFRVPFLEEVHATLHHALERSVNDARHFTVQLSKLMIDATVKTEDSSDSFWKFSLCCSSQRAVTAALRASDLLLLCRDELPEWDATRECLTNAQGSMKFLLAYVNHAREESSGITATAYAIDGSAMHERMAMASSEWRALSLGVSLIPAERIWNSIVRAYLSGRKSKMFVMQDVLRINQQVVPAGIDSLALRQTEDGAATLEQCDEYCRSRKLNDSQRGAVKSALGALLSPEGKPHVRLVQGPPGTGKTAMLVTLISVLGSLRNRTLIAAPTNAAVLELCKRMMSFFPGEEIFSTSCARAGILCSPVALRDIILVGTVAGMDGVVNGNAAMEKIFLPYRIRRLTAALHPVTGWKGCVQSVETFLTDSLAQFAWYFRCGSGKEDVELPENAAYWRFARERMVEMQGLMEEHLLVLLSELPKCHMDVQTSKEMRVTLELMSSVVDAMPLQPPADATTWFTAATVDPLLEALASRPGCSLLATEQNPQGREPKEEWLKSQCFKSATLVFSTVSAAGSPLMTGAAFECAILDEASQLVEAASIIVSGMRDLKQLVLVGDHKQLPGTVISKVAEKCGYGRSLFDRLQSLQHGCRHMLNHQYRMTPAISHFPNSQFYESALKDGSNVLAPDYGMSFALYGAYAFLNCGFGAEVTEPRGCTNPHELTVVTSLVVSLSKVCAQRKIKNLSVGVISPYALQVEAMKQALGQERFHSALDVEVKTVDGFQGNERDVIIFSAVRANSNNQIGFLNDSRRLNVAITRGRFCVWIVGNAETLSGGGHIWNNLITDAKARNCFHDLLI